MCGRLKCLFLYSYVFISMSISSALVSNTVAIGNSTTVISSTTAGDGGSRVRVGITHWCIV